MDKLSVIQADREAAAAFYGPHLSLPGEVPVTAHMRAGKIDESPLIQAFAQHRIASQAELVEALEKLADSVDRFNGVFSSSDRLAGRMQGEMWCARQAALRAIAKGESK